VPCPDPAPSSSTDRRLLSLGLTVHMKLTPSTPPTRSCHCPCRRDSPGFVPTPMRPGPAEEGTPSSVYRAPLPLPGIRASPGDALNEDSSSATIAAAAPAPASSAAILTFAFAFFLRCQLLGRGGA
jgi:hypothetical protein